MRLGDIDFFSSFFVKEILSFRLNLAFPDIGSLERSFISSGRKLMVSMKIKVSLR